jgi:predicted HAD superfamily Cof-like phosphohydrolase
MQTNHQHRIESFMDKAGQEVPDTPTMPDLETRKLRARLIMEEALETISKGLGLHVNFGSGPHARRAVFWDMFFTEHGPGDLVELADGCADVSVVTIGTLSACGIKDEALLEEVDSSNIKKFDEGWYKDEHGKVQKPPGWQPPNIEAVLQNQGLKP